MSTLVAPTVASISVDDPHPLKCMSAVFFARACIGIRTVSDLLERRFADLAGIPYQSPDSRQQWEDLWDAEAVALKLDALVPKRVDFANETFTSPLRLARK
jgi:hypothetical protein